MLGRVLLLTTISARTPTALPKERRRCRSLLNHRQSLPSVLARGGDRMLHLHQSIVLSGHRITHFVLPRAVTVTDTRVRFSMERPGCCKEKLFASHSTHTSSSQSLGCLASSEGHQPSTMNDDLPGHGLSEKIVGMLGGGQLGRMLCQAASEMAIKVAVLDPLESCPASAIACDHVVGRFDDSATVEEFAKRFYYVLVVELIYFLQTKCLID